MADDVRQVTMPDGRVVDFKGNRKMLKSYEIADGKVRTRFDFINGESINFELPDQLVLQSAGHGVVQKAGDSAAGEEKVEDMVIAVQDTLDSLAAGNWNTKREGGGFGGAGVVFRALCKVYAWTAEQGKAWVDKKIGDYAARGQKLTRQQLYAALRDSEKVGPVVKELEAAEKKRSVGIDSAALLEGLPTA